MKLVPSPRIPSSEWAEKYFGLPPENSDVAGNFDFYYAPHAYGIFAALDDPDITDVYCMKASQVCWTTILSAYLLSVIDQRPVTILGLFSVEQAAREYSTEKLTRYIECCPKIQAKVNLSKKAAGNGVLQRHFPGGFIKLLNSKVVRSLKSTSAPIIFVEEPDDAVDNVQGQGDPITVAYERSKRFRRPKRILGGTPTLKDFSRVAERMKFSDQSVLPVTCHGCGKQHVLDDENIKWLDADPGTPEHPIYGKALPETAFYGCPHCGEIWNDARRKENIRQTVATARAAGDKFAGWIPTKPEIKKVKGFTRLAELYSCIPGSSLEELVQKRLEAEHYAARGDETKLISYVNNQQGKEYEFKDGRPEPDVFVERAKHDLASQHDEFVCPRGGLLVTVGIDVQHDRVAIVIRAWGRDDESWLMYWGEIPAASTCVDIKDGIWDALDAVVFQRFSHESGAFIYASAVSIDSGDHSTNDAVYSWVRSRKKKYAGNTLVMAIKGSSRRDDPEIFTKPKKPIDHKRPDKQTKADKYGLGIYGVGTNKAKDWIAAHMNLSAEAGNSGLFHYYHPEQMRWDYFDQMFAEAKVPHKTIRNRKIWKEKSGRAHEALDCEVYSLHGARAKRVHLKTPSDWDRLEQGLLQVDLFQAPAIQAGLEPEQETKVSLFASKKSKKPKTQSDPYLD